MSDLIIGEPEIQLDYSESQLAPDNCAVCAETSIINQFFPELDLNQAEAAYISAENGWYQPGWGTSGDDMGNMLDLFGIESHEITNASVAQLAAELQQGHGVIVSVNSSELWDTGLLADLKNFLCELFGLDNSTWNPADHAICVTGMDLSDPANPMVIINDSGLPNDAGVGASYPLDKFLDAWENSDCTYIATNDPLPSLAAAGVNDPGFWGDFEWENWVSAGVGVGTGLWVGLTTGDVNLALSEGILAGSTVSALLENDDFARMI